MLQNLFVSATVISAISLLCRITLKETVIESTIEKLPYLLQKPIFCGVCRTFWIAFAFQFMFVRFNGYILFPYIQGSLADALHFLASWMVTGMISVFILYTFLAFYEGSHYLAHKAEEMHK